MNWFEKFQFWFASISPLATIDKKGSRFCYRFYRRFTKITGLENLPIWNSYHWKYYLQNEERKSQGVVGYDWGNPESANDRLGNYRHVLDLLQASINGKTRVLEIGSFGGKWTQYMGNAKSVTCVDLFEESFDFIKERLPHFKHLHFYKTKGDELHGIPTSSVDLVFSMDSLPVRKPIIKRYFLEISRVLNKPGGAFLVYLPYLPRGSFERKVFDVVRLAGKIGKVAFRIPKAKVEIFKKRWLRKLGHRWIGRSAFSAGINNYDIDFDTLKHGILFSNIKQL